MKPVNGYVIVKEWEQPNEGLYVPSLGDRYTVVESSDERFKAGDTVIAENVKELDIYNFVKADDVIGVQNA